MQSKKIMCNTQGQSLIELALVFSVLALLLLGMVEVVFICRTYLALLDCSYQGAHLGSQGVDQYDNSEIYTLVTQNLSREGYNTNSLIDVIITRADLDGGTVIKNYKVYNMKGSSRNSDFTPTLLSNRLRGGDPTGQLIVVEIVYDHNLLFDYPLISNIFPNPFPLVAYTIQYVAR